VVGRVVAPPLRPVFLAWPGGGVEQLSTYAVSADTLDELIDDLRVAAFLASVQSERPASGVTLERPIDARGCRPLGPQRRPGRNAAVATRVGL
jgi:hypothetical protein